MNSNVLIYIFFIILGLICFYYIYNFTIKTTPTHHDKPSTTIECGLLNPSTIQQCSLSDNTPCGDCRCNSDASLKMNCMKCQTTDGNMILGINNKNDCVGNNVEWKNMDSNGKVIPGGACFLKQGNYCLPNDVPDLECNPVTGRKILINNQAEYSYGWKCVCLNDQAISNNGSNSTCDKIYECGMDGSATPVGGRSLVLKGTNIPWNSKSDVDPFIGGGCECQCPDYEVSDNSTLSCLPNNCSPGKPVPGSSIDCNCSLTGTRYLNCTTLAQRVDKNFGPYFTGVCSRPSCIPDPCGGYPISSSNNYYDTTKNQCICDSDAGYIRTLDNGSVIGETCYQGCYNNDYCGGNGANKRGDCYLTSIPSNNVWYIVTQSQSQTGSTDPTPFTISLVNSNVNKGLLIDNGKITLSASNVGSEFIFEPLCYTSTIEPCPGFSSVYNLFASDQYYIKYKDTNQYLNFTTFTTTSTKPGDGNNTSESPTLIQLLQDEDCRDNPSYFKIVNIVANKYLSGPQPNTSDPQSTLQFLDGNKTAKCHNCLPNYKNDDICSPNVCLQRPSGCNNNSDCCSGNCSSDIYSLWSANYCH